MKPKAALILGSHKGLGYELVMQLLEHENISKVLGLSRTDSGDFKNHPKYAFQPYDFTKLYDQEDQLLDLVKQIHHFEPSLIFYCAGGGPYGPYGEKQWKDHKWSLVLNFLFPAQFLWHLIRGLKQQTQFIYIGSAIAESEVGDPLGASYAAGKWAMKGLIASLKNEQSAKNFEFKIISPGYMDTDLLPKNAVVRAKPESIASPKAIAEQIVNALEI